MHVYPLPLFLPAVSVILKCALPEKGQIPSNRHRGSASPLCTNISISGSSRADELPNPNPNPAYVDETTVDSIVALKN